MKIYNFFKWINILNPSSHGRLFVTMIALKLDNLPKDGVYCIEESVILSLHIDDFIDRNIFFRSYEFLPNKVIFSILRENSTFIDIGANIGYFSLKAYKRVGEGGKVLAFEPNPVTLAKLMNNINMNNANKSIEVYDIALSNKNGEVSIFCPKKGTHGFSSMQNQGWSDYDQYTVKAKILDEVVVDNLERIDLIKIDVEGAEKLVFEGACETIKKFKPKVILELNENAASRFNYNTLDALKLLLNFNPHYKFKYLDKHKILDVNLENLESRNLKNGNVLVY